MCSLPQGKGINTCLRTNCCWFGIKYWFKSFNNVTEIKVAVSIFHLKIAIYIKRMFHFTALWCLIFTERVLRRVWMLFSVSFLRSTYCAQLRHGTVVCQSSKSGWTIPKMIATITMIALEHCTDIHAPPHEGWSWIIWPTPLWDSYLCLGWNVQLTMLTGSQIKFAADVHAPLRIYCNDFQGC